MRRRLGHEKVSERRACKALAQPRSTQRYRLKQPAKDRSLIEAMRRIVDARPRFGCERLHPELIKQGWSVGFDRVHRLWKQEHMQVPRKQHKRKRIQGSGGRNNSCVRYKPTHRNHVWSYDFVSERTEDGRQQKLLVVIDEFTRECLAIEPARHFRGRDVVLTLQYLFAVRGAPEHLRSDNGLSSWPKRYSVGLPGRRCVPCTSRRPAPGRTATWNRSTANCEMNYSTASCSWAWKKPAWCWTRGGWITTTAARILH